MKCYRLAREKPNGGEKMEPQTAVVKRLVSIVDLRFALMPLTLL